MNDEHRELEASPDDPHIWRDIIGEFVMSGHPSVRVEVPAMPVDVIERGLAEAARDSEYAVVVYRDDEGIHLSRNAETQMRMRAFDEFIAAEPEEDLPQ